MPTMSDDDDVYDIPLQDRKAFGAGLKRKHINFVPSSSATLSSSSTPQPSTTSSAKSISERYLERVLSTKAHSEPPMSSNATSESNETITTVSTPLQQEQELSTPLCEVCKLPVISSDRPHEASLSHQVCLTHSHPPSHLDRRRKGLAILATQGWDPDSRLGLGAQGQGIQFPIKPKPKNDTMGLGLVLPKEEERRKKEKKIGLDAGKVRKLAEKDKRKGEKLRQMFYGNSEVEKYLGGGSGVGGLK